jgi:hypothetical protein
MTLLGFSLNCFPIFEFLLLQTFDGSIFKIFLTLFSQILVVTRFKSLVLLGSFLIFKHLLLQTLDGTFFVLLVSIATLIWIYKWNEMKYIVIKKTQRYNELEFY